jgi:hypothetical protein
MLIKLPSHPTGRPDRVETIPFDTTQLAVEMADVQTILEELGDAILSVRSAWLAVSIHAHLMHEH